MISRLLPAPVRRLLQPNFPSRPPEYQLIDQPGRLEPLLLALDRVDEVSLDTEADNMFHYKTRVCLLQFLVGREVFLVDAQAPLAFDGLWRRLAAKRLLLHGSDFDLRLLHDRSGFQPKSIFDTMLAAQLINRPRIGLAPLLEDYFGLKLSKDSQKANWSRRPLPEKMLDYAALDVWYLPALRDILSRELDKLGRREWHEQECAAQITAGATGFAPHDDNDWRIGSSERMRGAGLGVLHAVWHWREQTAERLDTPPFKVCHNRVLLQLAQAAEDGESEQAILQTVNLGKRHPRLLPSLAAAVRAGLARDPQTLPRRRRTRDPEHAPLTPHEAELQDRIKNDRDRIARRLSLDPTLIANRSQLARIARHPRQLDEILLPWQAGLLRHEPSLAQA